MTFRLSRHGRHRPSRTVTLGPLALALVLGASFWALTPGRSLADEPSPDDKAAFLETVCAPVDKPDRCLGAGKLVLNRSLAWIVFEACSGAGIRASIVECFDRAHRMAFELTGDASFERAHQSCNRFQGGQVEEAKLLCYRADFKYARNYTKLREAAEDSETGAAGVLKR